MQEIPTHNPKNKKFMRCRILQIQQGNHLVRKYKRKINQKHHLATCADVLCSNLLFSISKLLNG
jgi:hypothetical protein